MRSVWGWKWDRLHMLAVYATQPHVQIQHLHLMHLTPRVLSLCLVRFKVMTETNRPITTDLFISLWWLDIMQILNTCKHITLKTHFLLIQTWICVMALYSWVDIHFSVLFYRIVYRVCFNHPANHPIFYNLSLRRKKKKEKEKKTRKTMCLEVWPSCSYIFYSLSTEVWSTKNVVITLDTLKRGCICQCGHPVKWAVKCLCCLDSVCMCEIHRIQDCRKK